MAVTDQLRAIADAIREKTGRSDLISFKSLDDEIRSIPSRVKGDVYATDKAIVVPAGLYKENLLIHFGEWEWDPLNFEEDLIYSKQIET